MKTVLDRGWCGALGIVAVVVAWDFATIRRGGQTISNWWGLLLAAPATAAAATMAWLLITLHLFGRWIPRWLHRFDPIAWIARRLQP